MPVAKVNGIGMYYEAHGEGEPLVMVAGYGCDSGIWFRQTPGLSAEYQVVILDNRGTGRSDKPDIPYTMQMMAADVAGLLDYMGIGAAHMYGHSMGGMIAQEFALRYQQRTASLILACTSASGGPVVLADDEVNALVFDFHSAEGMDPKERIRRLLPLSFSREFIESNPDVLEENLARRIEYPTPTLGLMRQLEAIMTADTYDRLPKLELPTLVVGGLLDRINPVENQRVLASRIPHAELVIMDHLGHGLYIEGVDDVNRVMIDFLRRHPIS